MSGTVRPELSRSSWRATRQRVRKRDGNRCQVCGSDGWLPAHFSKSGRFIPGRYLLIVGHIIPAERWMALGGHHDDPVNLRTMCTRCNNSQGDKTDAEWQAAKAARAAAPSAVPRTSEPTRSAFGRGPGTLARPRIY